MPDRLSRRAFLKSLGALALTVPAGWIYSAEVERRWLAVERVTVSLPALPPAFHGLTLAVCGDWHIGPYISANEIHAAVDEVLRLRADAVLLTGDFVSSSAGYETELLAAELKRLSAPLGVYAVLGNHDWWHRPEAVRAAMAQSGARLLQNESVMLTRNGENLFLVGLDSYFERHTDIPRALAHVPPSAPAIVLAHEPDVADLLSAEPRALLQISGHSHGGQVRLPGLKPLLLPVYGEKYPLGLQRAGGLWVYTNRGIGVTKLPVRFNCRPEVTLLMLDSHSARTT